MQKNPKIFGFFFLSMVIMNSQGKRTNRQINETQVLFALKKVMKTQRAAARAVDCSEDMFRYYLTYAKKIPVEISLRAKVILRAHLEKISELSDKDLLIRDELLTVLPLSMQAELAREELAKGKNKLGKKVKNPQKKNKKRENFPKKERLDEIIAKKYSFKNRKTLHQAIYVIENGCSELIQVMDKDILKVYLAAQIATLIEAEQRNLLTQELKMIRAYFKTKKSKIARLLNAIKTDELLKDIEQHTQRPIIKRIEAIVHSIFMNREKNHSVLTSVSNVY